MKETQIRRVKQKGGGFKTITLPPLLELKAHILDNKLVIPFENKEEVDLLISLLRTDAYMCYEEIQLNYENLKEILDNLYEDLKFKEDTGNSLGQGI